GRLRQLIEHARVGITRHCIQIVIEFLHVLPVIALLVREPKQSLLQDWIPAVPQGDRQAQELPVIATASDPILPPAIGTTARLVVAEVIPGGTIRAVILPHRAPLPLADIRAPAAPILHAVAAFLDASLFSVN